MKKSILLLNIILLSIFTTSCNKDWTEEQYEQYVSIVAPMEWDFYTTIYLRYKEDGKATYKLPIEVTGSTNNSKTRNVYLVEDLDTLSSMNIARYGSREEMYFKALEKDKFYTLPEVVQIPKGENKVMADINFNLTGIDMNEKWVVPLRLAKDDSYDYVPHPRKNYAEAVLRVVPFNDFSGNYSTATQTVTLVDESDNKIGDPMTTNSRTAFVVDENTVFFYAGLISSDLKDRHLYKINVKFLGADSDNPGDKKIEISCEHKDEIGFKLNTLPQDLVYSTAVVDDSVYPYLEHHYVTINIDYSFNDVTSAKDENGDVVPIRYRVQGVMILERNINTLIPDEDQAIQW